MKTIEFLKNLGETVPNWLKHYRGGEAVAMADFFNSRIVYYPGSGHDGHPIAIFGASHAAHCFVYADYGVSQKEVEQDLDSPSDSLKGYRTLARIKVSESELTPNGWSTHILPREIPDGTFTNGFVAPYGLLVIFERFEGLDEKHGPVRLAVLFLGADGIASYDALFCQTKGKAPFCLVIQDHGFGGNYDAFGRLSLLNKVAARAMTYPEFLLVASNSESWSGYQTIPGLEPTQGGQHFIARTLYQRTS